MTFFSRKLPSSPPPANGLASQSTTQHLPVCQCTWTARAPKSGSSPLPFPRSGHTLTATATAAGELFLFGGYVRGARASSDLYIFSTQDFSTTLLQTSGDVPTPRRAHGAALIGTTLLICGGKTNSGDQYVLNHDSFYLLNLVSREWTRVVVNGPGPNGHHYHTTTVVGSKLFVFGGRIGGKTVNDMWTLDLNCLKSLRFWKPYEPTPGNEKPLPRAPFREPVTFRFGGYGDQQDYYNDTWSFDISTRKWTKLQCTGSIPSPRAGHAAVLVDDIMYVFGGFTGKTYSDDLYALQLSTQRWFNLHNVGPSPHRRAYHTMGSDGTRVFVLGGYSKGAREDEISLIHVFDTRDIKYPEPERNAINPNEKTNQLARKSFTGLPTQEQSPHPKSSSSETPGSRLQSATLAVLGHPASLQITHERNPGPNGRPSELTGVNNKPGRVPKDDVSEGSTGYHTKFAAPHSSSEGEVTRLDRQLSTLLAVQTERDQRITRLSDELALNSALLEQVKASVAERAKLELREHEVRLLAQTSLVKQRDEELVDMHARLKDMQAKLDEQVGRHEKELINVRAKLEANESELEAVRLRLKDAEKSLTRSKAEAEALRAQTATGSVNRDEDQVTRRLMERMRALEAEVASKRWNEKRIEEMECRNEG